MSVEFSISKPCRDCPFVRNNRMHLSRGRKEEIAAGLQSDYSHFTCHKLDRGLALRRKKGVKAHCAGAAILLEKTGRHNILMRLAKFWDEYPNMRNKESVYESWEEFINEDSFRG